MVDIASLRLRNTLDLYDAFARQAAPLGRDSVRGLDALFCNRIQISPAQWSRFKSGANQIGEKLARQIEALSGKPYGWLDERHHAQAAVKAPETALPANDEERFAVALFLTAYRANPAGVKARLLDVVGGELAKQSAPATPPRLARVISHTRTRKSA
ncbi:MAG TPA: hypothetical protein VFR86_07345 [Burkholderiaceae bacterium]|nr:hypothetical protein [Burkholderiaceae bacterium]